MTLRIEAAGELKPSGRHASRWVEQVLGRSYHQYCPSETWAPAVNLYEGADHYCVVVDLAGMSADKIDLRLDKGLLMISGERPTPGMGARGKPLRIHLMEIDHGAFCRSVEVPSDVDSENIAASYRAGYLFVHLPRKGAK